MTRSESRSAVEVVGQMVLVQRYPGLVGGAFSIIARVGKLCACATRTTRPPKFALAVARAHVVIFAIAFAYAKLQGPVEETPPIVEKAESILAGDKGRAAGCDRIVRAWIFNSLIS